MGRGTARVASLAAVLLLAACGEEDGTGYGEPIESGGSQIEVNPSEQEEGADAEAVQEGPDAEAVQERSDAGAAQGDAAELPPEGSMLTVSGEELNFHGRKQVTGEARQVVRMQNFYFDPTLLAGEASQELVVQLRNPSSLSHTFTISDQNVDVVVQPGESAEATVTFPTDEPRVFICRFHAAQGMRGALTLGNVVGNG